METPAYSHLSSEDFRRVYEPAEDTFLLLDALEGEAESLASRRPALCLEVGSGAGLLSAALARLLGAGCACLAVEAAAAACRATAATARANACRVEVVRGDLASALAGDGRVDVLVCNPPYVPTEESPGADPDRLSRAWVGGACGRQVMDRLFPDVPRLLSKQGVFYLLVIMENKPLEIQELMAGYGFQMTVLKDRKIRGEHLVVLKFTRESEV
ncbi:methyltransferase N6AMT1 [Bacillus rossius redtenbacheri]|uniref:methyltransferase N6AMT1 n=1 Tax=Bacillus rossius redtenbacheri TaxID=93214 RepID=UPI002FDE6A0C